MDNTVELLKVYLALNGGHVIVDYPFGRFSNQIDAEFFGGNIFGDPAERQPMIIRCTTSQLNRAKTEYYYGANQNMAKSLKRTYREVQVQEEERRSKLDVEGLIGDMAVAIAKVLSK